MIRRTAILVGVKALALVVVWCAASACSGEGFVDFIVPDAGQDGAGGEGGEGGADGGPSSSGGGSNFVFACEDDCVPLPPLHFSDPLLVWIGDEAQKNEAPSCPPHAPVLQFEAHGDLSIPAASCSPCSCGPSMGSCTLPTSIVAHNAPCNGADSATDTPSDVPASWDGSCSAENPIPAGALCLGELCVQSITIAPMEIEDACAASGTSTAPLSAPSFGQFARACEGITSTGSLGCGDPGEVCMPQNVEGFRQCVEQEGIHDCPVDGYTEQFLLYDDFVDERFCSACSCGAPQGSVCAADVQMFADVTCTSQTVNIGISSEKETCFDVNPSGKAIVGKTAEGLYYQPGVCEAFGGELVGDVVLTNARTVCCLP